MQNDICPACKSTNTSRIDHINTHHPAYSSETSLLKCTDCTLFFASPLPDEKKLSEIYSGEYHYPKGALMDKLVDAWTTSELVSDRNLVLKYKNAGKILDIGAGRGDMLVQFPVNLWERSAFDPFLSQTDIAELKKKIGSQVNDFDSLEKYPENTFDVVMLRNVIEHTAAFPSLLKNIYRIIKKDGILCIRTPNIASEDFKKLGTNWYVVFMPGHIVFFDTKTLSDNLLKAGFQVPYVKHTLYSAPTSYFKSSKPQPSNMVLRLIYSFYFMVSNILTGQGGDLRAVAKK